METNEQARKELVPTKSNTNRPNSLALQKTPLPVPQSHSVERPSVERLPPSVLLTNPDIQSRCKTLFCGLDGDSRCSEVKELLSGLVTACRQILGLLEQALTRPAEVSPEGGDARDAVHQPLDLQLQPGPTSGSTCIDNRGKRGYPPSVASLIGKSGIREPTPGSLVATGPRVVCGLGCQDLPLAPGQYSLDGPYRHAYVTAQDAIVLPFDEDRSWIHIGSYRANLRRLPGPAKHAAPPEDVADSIPLTHEAVITGFPDGSTRFDHAARQPEHGGPACYIQGPCEGAYPGIISRDCGVASKGVRETRVPRADSPGLDQSTSQMPAPVLLPEPRSSAARESRAGSPVVSPSSAALPDPKVEWVAIPLVQAARVHHWLEQQSQVAPSESETSMSQKDNQVEPDLGGCLEMEQDPTPGPVTPSCQGCGRVGHFLATCPHRTRCKLCGDVGHRHSHCPNQLQCQYCGRFGHSEASCRVAARDRYKAPVDKKPGKPNAKKSKGKATTEEPNDEDGGLASLPN